MSCLEPPPQLVRMTPDGSLQAKILEGALPSPASEIVATTLFMVGAYESGFFTVLDTGSLDVIAQAAYPEGVDVGEDWFNSYAPVGPLAEGRYGVFIDSGLGGGNHHLSLGTYDPSTRAMTAIANTLDDFPFIVRDLGADRFVILSWQPRSRGPRLEAFTLDWTTGALSPPPADFPWPVDGLGEILNCPQGGMHPDTQSRFLPPHAYTVQPMLIAGEPGYWGEWDTWGSVLTYRDPESGDEQSVTLPSEWQEQRPGHQLYLYALGESAVLIGKLVESESGGPPTLRLGQTRAPFDEVTPVVEVTLPSDFSGFEFETRIDLYATKTQLLIGLRGEQPIDESVGWDPDRAAAAWWTVANFKNGWPYPARAWLGPVVRERIPTP